MSIQFVVEPHDGLPYHVQDLDDTQNVTTAKWLDIVAAVGLPCVASQAALPWFGEHTAGHESARRGDTRWMHSHRRGRGYTLPSSR